MRKAGCDYIEFNLIKQPEIVDILASATGIDDLILKLSLYSDQRIVPGKTVFFFDEIQRHKEIVTQIKFLVEDKRYRYVLSGSLLGVEITNLKSAPVGYLQTLNMYPLDFEEFLQIFNVSEAVIENLRRCFVSKTPVDEMIHGKIMEIFNLYMMNRCLQRAVDAEGLADDYLNWSDNHRGTWYYYEIIEAANHHDYERSERPSQSDYYEDWTVLNDLIDWAYREREWVSTYTSE